MAWGVIGPMESWLVIRGMRTLDLRMRRHQETAQAVAEYLEGHPKVKRVYYPGLKSHPQFELIQKQQSGSSGLMSLELNAPADDSLRFVDALKLFRKGCSWGALKVWPWYRYTIWNRRNWIFLILKGG